MTEDSKVKVVSNNGAKSRWGLSTFMYKIEGKKRSLNTKVLISFLGIFVVISVTYSLVSEFFSPTPTKNQAIGFKDPLVSQNEEIETINLNNSKLSPQRKRISKLFERAQIINRDNKMQIPGGLLVKAQILSQSPQGLIRALLLDPIVVQGEEIISSGATLSGPSQSSEDRLHVKFTKIIDKSGKSYPVQALACDESDQALGIKGQKTSRTAWLMATQTGLTILSQASQGINSTSLNNTISAEEQLKKSAINQASKSALDQSQNYLADFKNQKSMIQVDSGTTIYILFEGE